jgi:hypothetical protein
MADSPAPLSASDFYFSEYEGIWLVVTKTFYDKHRFVDDSPTVDVSPIMPSGFYKSTSAGFTFHGKGGRRKARKLLLDAGFTDADK